MEVVKFEQAQLINSDLDMYYPKTDTPALCRTSSLVEELGQIEFIFSDKTGTLTRNEMEFRQCSIAGVPYSDIVDESKAGELFDFDTLNYNLRKGDGESQVISEFLQLLATCHTVIPEEKNGKMTYQASSPDEAALVAGAEVLGHQFTVSCSFGTLTSLHQLTLMVRIDAEADLGVRQGWRAGAGISSA